MPIICDVSAWEYLRTPPIVRNAELTPGDVEAQGGAGAGAAPLEAEPRQRTNMREVDRLIAGRLLTDLKGVSLPVHVMVEPGCSCYHSDLVHVHRVPKGLPRHAATPIGAGLSVLAPEFVVTVHSQFRTAVQIAKMMFEACGIFAICPGNKRVSAAIRQLGDAKLLDPDLIPASHRIFAYYGAGGKRADFVGWEGDALPWVPSFNRSGALTSLWKRPPLTSVEELAQTLDALDGLDGQGSIRYLDKARQALGLVLDGAASPAEVQAALLFCAPARHGGEGWSGAQLNRVVSFTPEAKKLAGTSFAVADFLWPEANAILEVNGKDYHSEGGYFVDTGRRPALQSLGYAVGEVTPAQMSDPDLLETMSCVFSELFGFEQSRRTRAFFAKRRELCAELFDRPFEPSWTGARRQKGRL